MFASRVGVIDINEIFETSHDIGDHGGDLHHTNEARQMIGRMHIDGKNVAAVKGTR